MLNLDNSGDLPDYMAASEVKLYMISGCVDAGLLLKPADYSMISMPYFPVTTTEVDSSQICARRKRICCKSREQSPLLISTINPFPLFFYLIQPYLV